MTDSIEGSKVKINKPAIISLVSLANVIGLAPLTLTIHRPWLLAYIFCGTLFVTSLAIKNKQTNSTESPGLWELLLAGMGAIFPAALVGLVWLFLYGLIYFVTKFIEFILHFFTSNASINADMVAYYPTLAIMTLVGLLFSVVSANNAIDQLYSNIAGIKSVFYKMMSSKGKRLKIGILIMLALLMAWVGYVALNTQYLSSWWSNTVILLYLLFSTTFLSTASIEVPKVSENRDDVQALCKLFEASGYDVTISPMTDRPDLDPLLVNLDLFAYNESLGSGYAVEIPELSKITDSANMTVTAAWALQDFIQGKSSQQPVVVSKPTVVPAIVLIDSKQEDIDRNLKEKHPIKIIRIPNTQVISSILKADKEGLEKYARNILNIDKIKPKTEGDIAERGILGIKSRTPQKNREGDAAI